LDVNLTQLFFRINGFDINNELRIPRLVS